MSDDLTYGEYLQLKQVLNAQKLRSDPPHHDELLFITIHQSFELWFKLMLHEFDTAVDRMRSERVLHTTHFIGRAAKIMGHLISQIHLLETMAPADFLAFRDQLGPSSGFQSFQFRELEFFLGLRNRKYLEIHRDDPEASAHLEKRLSQPSVKEELYELLRKREFRLPKNAAEAEEDSSEYQSMLMELRQIYQNQEPNLHIFLLCEALVDFDENFTLFRFHHTRVVERIIGNHRGTGGSPGVRYLESTVGQKCFQLLWDIRTTLEKPVTPN